jgi:hypothetical protein
MVKSQTGGALFGANDYTNYTSDTGVNSGVIQYLFYFGTILIVGLIILVIVNTTLYPIFKTRPGGQGLVPLPGSDSSKLYWKSDKDIHIIQDTASPLGSTVSNWSFLLDIQVDNPTSNTNTPRILFTRGALLTAPTEPYTAQDTILKLANNFNVCVWLDRMTNDLFIAVLTVEDQQNFVETVKIPNIPVRKAVRLGCMVGSRVLEVYINGYLIKSKTYNRSLRTAVGSLQPPNDSILSSTARVRNLRIWSTPIPPSEFRSYGSAPDFDLKALPDSCSA